MAWDRYRLAAGARVRALRDYRGLTLADLADLVDVSPSTLSRIERGSQQADDELRYRLAVALGVEPGALWDWLVPS